MKLFFLLGNQLFSEKYLEKYRKDHFFFMAEDYQLCTYEKHHKQKILLFLSCMRSHADRLKKNKFKLSQFSLIQIMVTVGLIFLVPQFLYEQSIGLDLKINKAFIFILLYVVIFPAIAAYYCWQKAIELIGPNRSSMFIQLMPLFSAIMAILIFKEKFQLFHFIGATFIISGIYLSNRKTQ